ncbi:uncharacterized protein [Drosophila bipectinata]|uniref:uncharacterized protein n=1 Tax=Drosophila bipectinata TaxID=42026 RepID=UPI0038B3DFDF
MQNSQVIGKVNEGLRRCWSHHRRLCDDIAELDRLFGQDEFLLNPRRLWQLIQQQQHRQDEFLEPEIMDVESRMGLLNSRKCLISQTLIPIKIEKTFKTPKIIRPLRKLLQPENSSRTNSKDSTNPRPAPTPLPSPERRPRMNFGRPLRKLMARNGGQNLQKN